MRLLSKKATGTPITVKASKAAQFKVRSAESGRFSHTTRPLPQKARPTS